MNIIVYEANGLFFPVVAVGDAGGIFPVVTMKVGFWESASFGGVVATSQRCTKTHRRAFNRGADPPVRIAPPSKCECLPSQRSGEDRDEEDEAEIDASPGRGRVGQGD